MITDRSRRCGPLLLAAAVLGAVMAPGVALADGPGYGGNADALTVQWQSPADAGSDGLAVYAYGFRGGSPVNLRVGATAEKAVTTDASGALRVLMLDASATAATASAADLTVLAASAGTAGRLSPGTSVVAVGETPEGNARTLIGSVPPPAGGRGVQDVVPWAGAVAVAGGAVLWLRRNPVLVTGLARRYRHPARHRA